MKLKLPVLDSLLISRRTILATAGASGLAACGNAVGLDGGRDAAADSATGTDAPASDTHVTPQDASRADTATGTDAGAPDTAGPTCAGRNVGSVGDFPMGSFTELMSIEAILGHDSGGLYAYSSRCTHRGCTIPAPTAGSSVCACHGSEFDANGAVLGGPATTPLRHYALAICAGAVFVDTARTVPASTRTPAA